jgi:methionyl aminopeptidase
VGAEAVHGIPGSRSVAPGELVKIDVTASLGGYVADAAVTVVVPPADADAERLARTAELALVAGIEQARAGRPVNVIGGAVERQARRRGCRVLRGLTGHGVGRAIHEPPTVANYRDPRHTTPLRAGLVITIEPLVTLGRDALYETGDGWTVRTLDGAPVAHAEHTIVVTRGRPLVLTAA